MPLAQNCGGELGKKCTISVYILPWARGYLFLEAI